MQIVIAAVGRAKRGPEAELVAEYLERTRWAVSVKELADAPEKLAPDARRAQEAAAIEKLLEGGARLIALDSSGEQLSSPEFAGLIAGAQRDGVKKLVFAIGGQDGLDAALVKKAKRTIAFGRATWPHKLARVLLAEQVYRAYTISIGHPYHEGH